MFYIRVPTDALATAGQLWNAVQGYISLIKTDSLWIQQADGSFALHTQSMPSGALNPPSDETPAADLLSMAGGLEGMESEETSGQRQSGGETADESWDFLQCPGGRRTIVDEAPQSAPISPPSTPANGQPTKSGPTTTPSADCLSAYGLVTMRALAATARELQAAILATTQPMLRLATLIEESADFFASTTAAQPTPSEGQTPTSPGMEGTEPK